MRVYRQGEGSDSPGGLQPASSWVLDLSRLSRKPFDFSFNAEPARRLDVKQRLALLDLASLKTTGRVWYDEKTAIYQIEGSISSSLVQECVVSFEPVPGDISLTFERSYVKGQSNPEKEIDVDAEEPEILEELQLDIAEIVSEELALALDPYPRAPGADQFLEQFHLEDEEIEKPSGGKLADALAALKNKDNNA